MKEILNKWMGEVLFATVAITIIGIAGYNLPACNQMDHDARVERINACANACGESGVLFIDQANPGVCRCRP